MKLKVSYRVTNWKQYNQALRRRGDIRLWIQEGALKAPPKKGRGRPPKYSAGLIEMALSMKHIYQLSLRATQGFLDSILALGGYAAECCDYTLLSKRAAEVGKKIEAALRKNEVVNLAIDTTGLKVYGDGEWKVKLHGAEKRRVWRKLSLAVDTDTHQIVGYSMSKSSTTDGQAMKNTLRNVTSARTIYADGAYDQKRCYEEAWRLGAKPLVPPRKTSNPQTPVWTIPEQLRSRNVRAARDLGLEAWKVGSGYHKRSLVETAMGRFKKTFTGTLASRSFQNQESEAAIKVKMMNRLTSLGMPETKSKREWVK